MLRWGMHLERVLHCGKLVQKQPKAAEDSPMVNSDHKVISSPWLEEYEAYNADQQK